MGAVQSSSKSAPIPKRPRSWKALRIEPTHFIYNGWITHGGKGSGKGTPDIPAFGTGWRMVRLELEGRKWAHVIECGTGQKAQVELEQWQKLARHGRSVA